MKKFFFIASAILLTWIIGNGIEVYTDYINQLNSGCYETVLVDKDCYSEIHSVEHCRIK